jgi:Glycoside-hydrolase family GH114
MCARGAEVKCVIASATLIATLAFASSAPAKSYRRPPSTGDSWYWEISAPKVGLVGLPAARAAYPAPGSAYIWDTDLFYDSNRSFNGRHGNPVLRPPTGRSAVVRAIHRAGHYSVCYVEVGAFQTNFPDNSHFAPADFGYRARRYNYYGYPNEWWFDTRGFASYVPGHPRTLTGAARNIAPALAYRFRWCKLEGHDAVEPDDLDGYTNRGVTGVPGAGWGLTQADAQGFERWIAYQVHADGMAVFQKNDPGNAKVNARMFDGVITEECNAYRDPCAGRNGDWNVYLAARKPVLNAEYRQDGERASRFCAADQQWGIWGALFSVNLDGARTYKVCWTSRGQL